MNASLPKHKYLLSYRYSEILFSLTGVFCERFVSRFSRTYDQMIQASRSGKQNIVEAVAQSITSKRGEMKLLGVANGSIEELTADFEDFLRKKGLPILSKESPQIVAIRRELYRITNEKNLNVDGEFIERIQLPEDLGEAANVLLTISHITSYLLSKQIAALVQKFSQEGGFTENLFRKRISYKSLK